MKEVMLLLAIGLAVGVPAAIGLGRYVSSQLYGIQPNDPVDRDCDDGDPDDDIGGSGIDSGDQGEPDRSDPGAAIRVELRPTLKARVPTCTPSMKTSTL